MRFFWEMTVALFLALAFLGILILINNHVIVIDSSLQHLSSPLAIIYVVAGLSALYLLLGFRELPEEASRVQNTFRPRRASFRVRIARAIKLNL